MNDPTPGQVAYDAYRKYAGGRSLVSGTELPAWETLPGAIKGAWEAAAEAASHAFRSED